MKVLRANATAIAVAVSTCFFVGAVTAGAVPTSGSRAHAATVLRNGTFQQGIRGWWGYHARLTRAHTPHHATAARAVVRRKVTRGGVVLWPRVRTQLRRGSLVRATAAVRAGRRGDVVCLRVRTLAGARVDQGRASCVRANGRWQRVTTPRVRTRRADDSIGFGVYLVRPRIGATLVVDDAAVHVVRALARNDSVGSSPGGLLVGISANAQGSSDPAHTESQVVDLGIHNMREDFVRSGPGTFDQAKWDRIFTGAAQRQITILPLFTNASDYRDGAFVAAAVARYAPGGTFWRDHPELDPHYAPVFWEVGNEPYYKGETAQGYARDFRAAVVAGRSANPNAKFLVAAYVDWLDRAAGRWTPWVDSLYEAVPDLNAYADGWTLHPYPDGRDPLLWTPSTSDWNYQYQQFLRIHDEFAAHGAGALPMWITEIGWTTTGKDSVSADEQARFMLEAADLLKGLPWAKALFYYQLQDGGPADGDPEHGYGVLAANGSPKPAYSALRSIASAHAAR